MKLAIMQPYFLPYIGYFQLINAVDEFVIYDNIKYTKRGWINRNRLLVNGQAEYITLPLKSDSDYLNVCQRQLADSWFSERNKFLNRIHEFYRKATFFHEVYPVIEKTVLHEDINLFNFNLNSIRRVTEYLGITTPFVISSTIPIDHTLKAQEKVLAICRLRNASIYINPVGGLELYSKEEFMKSGISLQFLKTGNLIYKQFDNEFIQWLSIVDVMMFNAPGEIMNFITEDYICI